MGIATEMKELTQDIAASREERLQKVAEIREEAKQARGEAQNQLKGFQTTRQRARVQLRKDLAQETAHRKSGVKRTLEEAQGLVNGFGSLRREQGAQMRQELAQSMAERKSEVKEVRREFRKAQAEVKADLKEAAAAWQGLAHTTTAKRASKAAEVEIPDLETKLRAVINKHPDGITLAEVADRLGVVPVVLGRASKSLLEKGKIRKENKFYFPLASE